MKKKLILTAIFTVVFWGVSWAQYVNLPDTNFRNYLKNLYPACFNAAGQMDTTCNDIVNEDQLVVYDNNSIRNIEGVKYFKTLDNLRCYYVPVDSISELPTSLRVLHCYVTNLRKLPPLPAGLQSLQCAGSNITYLPELPAGLEYLDCSRNYISTLPALPNILNHLDCNRNPIHSIQSLPDSLRYFDCSEDSLTSLPVIPQFITTLYCNYNQLTTLPTFANNGALLQSAVFTYNRLTSLITLPKAYSLDCSKNQITSIREINGPRNLNLSDNQLTSLPDTPRIQFLDIRGNNINCLPKITRSPWGITNVYVDDKVKCTPWYDANVIYRSSTRNDPNTIFTINLPVCNPTNNIYQCKAFPQITGKVFYDDNDNGVKDTNEKPLQNIRLNVSGNSYTFSDGNGEYRVSADSLGSYTINMATDRYIASPANASFSFTAYDTTVTKDFALRINQTFAELRLKIIPFNWAARPGFSYPYLVHYENTGAITLNPNIVFAYDSARLMYDSSSNHAVTVNGNNISLAAGTFTPGQQGSFWIFCRVKPTTAIGDTFFAKATATLHPTTLVVRDSIFTIVRGSYDPNDKQATPQLSPSQVANGDYIDYTIRFQNTGTDTAFTVVISDTLSNDLQKETLQMIATSHNCKTTVKNNVVFFEFLNILLPDSNVNEPLSHGFVSFKIKPQPNVAVNTVIPNKAAIYFDYNAPVITNMAGTLIKEFTVVPLQLISFSAVPQNDNTTALYWNTANEINTKQFVIEMSNDGLRFTRITNVVAKGKANNHYNTAIAASNTGIIFYRLKIVDNDGSFTYSPIIKIDKRKNAAGFSILSNPVKDVLIISISDKALNNTQANIINMQGAVVKTFIAKEGSQTIEIKDLLNGIYYLRTVNGSSKIVVQ